MYQPVIDNTENNKILKNSFVIPITYNSDMTQSASDYVFRLSCWMTSDIDCDWRIGTDSDYGLIRHIQVDIEDDDLAILFRLSSLSDPINL